MAMLLTLWSSEMVGPCTGVGFCTPTKTKIGVSSHQNVNNDCRVHLDDVPQ